ncbi:helix-turn-helix domain-containing protein [Accumulibacter sp.]|uniref:helix-turn-helix domain-containing protein n=1 Tax=Accumulibacter sp. TaxID=2053492 RepID=UPI001A3C903A|nr:helix-turn-helix domain-containing protein [Accumulibacter sp.]MBL8374557.1 helix-turn-helix domain-containing protein [Accumulibacter sp.]
MSTPEAPRADARHLLSTEEAAARLGIKAQTLRAALCHNGEYYGIRPFKSKNRFLRWPAAAVEALTAGEAA